MRSAGVLHARSCGVATTALFARAGDGRRGPVVVAVVKETILESEQTKSVSIPSALAADAGAGSGLLVLRTGRVKLRRPSTLR